MSTGQFGLPFWSGIKAPQAGRRSGGGGAASHGKGEPFLSPIRWMGEDSGLCKLKPSDVGCTQHLAPSPLRGL